MVTSFTGTYRADRWSLMLSNSSSQGIETLFLYVIVDQFRHWVVTAMVHVLNQITWFGGKSFYYTTKTVERGNN